MHWRLYFLAASEGEVKQRAEQWDQPVAEYIKLAERYLGFQQAGSVYGFADAGDGYRRVCSSSFKILSVVFYQNFVELIELEIIAFG